jgi:hypothetical protein
LWLANRHGWRPVIFACWWGGGCRLQDTYEEKEGKTVGRYQVYDDYIEYCAQTGHLATNNAALGKIFKVMILLSRARFAAQRIIHLLS